MPPALPRHLRHRCLPSLSLVFIPASAHTHTRTNIHSTAQSSPGLGGPRLRQGFIRINVALQRRVSAWLLPGVPGERVPSSPLSHPMKARRAARSPDQHGQRMTELFSSGVEVGEGLGGPRGKQSILYSICSHVYRMSYYIVQREEDQSPREASGQTGGAASKAVLGDEADQ